MHGTKFSQLRNQLNALKNKLDGISGMGWEIASICKGAECPKNETWMWLKEENVMKMLVNSTLSGARTIFVASTSSYQTTAAKEIIVLLHSNIK